MAPYFIRTKILTVNYGNGGGRMITKLLLGLRGGGTNGKDPIDLTTNFNQSNFFMNYYVIIFTYSGTQTLPCKKFLQLLHLVGPDPEQPPMHSGSHAMQS